MQSRKAPRCEITIISNWLQSQNRVMPQGKATKITRFLTWIQQILYMPVHLHHVLNQVSGEERMADTWEHLLKCHLEKENWFRRP